MLIAGGRVLKPVMTPEAENRLRRSRPDDSSEPSPFADYWDSFLVKHRDPRNVSLHCFGVILFYVPALAAVLTKNPWWLTVLPLSQIVGLIGHHRFERSPVDPFDAVLTLRASLALNRMFILVLRGKYFAEANRAAARLESWRASRRKAAKSREAVLA